MKTLGWNNFALILKQILGTANLRIETLVGDCDKTEWIKWLILKIIAWYTGENGNERSVMTPWMSLNVRIKMSRILRKHIKNEFWMDSWETMTFVSWNKWIKNHWRNLKTNQGFKREIWMKNKENGRKFWKNSWNSIIRNRTTSFMRVLVRVFKTRDDFKIANGTTQIWSREKLHRKIGPLKNFNRNAITISSYSKCPCWRSSRKSETRVKSCWSWKR